jgi:6-phosphogluconolactonase (cycloisomerase 2 family)
MRLFKLVRFISVLFSLVLIVSCGSGSSSSSTPITPTITSFYLQAFDGGPIGPIYNGVISQSDHQIIVVIPSDVAERMIATFTTQNATSVMVNDFVQTSQVTVNTFVSESSLTYTLVATDGSHQDYTVLRLAPVRGSLTPLSTESIDSGGLYPTNIAIHPNGEYAYVVNNNSIVSMFHIGSIGESAGILVPFSPESVVTVGSSSISIVLTPDGRFAYVSNDGESTITMFRIESSGESAGVLVPLQPESIASAESSPTGLAITADGEFLYALNLNSGSISMFRIESSGESAGALVPLSTPNISLNQSTPVSIAITPAINGQQFVYVVGFLSDSIAMFKVESSGETRGQLTPLEPPTLLAGASFSIAVTPNGRFAYMAGYNDNTTLMLNINQTDSPGALSFMSPASVIGESGPIGVAISPSGEFAYVANNISSSISAFGIDSNSGLLSPLSDSYSVFNTTSTLFPFTITIHPNGNFLYVTNLNPNTISMFKIN